MTTQRYIDLINNVTSNRWGSIFGGIGMTILLVVTSIIFAAAIGAGLFVWKSKGSKTAAVVTNLLDQFMTYIPVSTWIILVFYLLFRGKMNLNFIAADFALSVHFGVIIYGVMNSAINSLEEGKLEAAISMGYSRYQAIKNILIPEALPEFLGRIRIELIYHISYTAVVEVISVMEIQMVADIIAAETGEFFVPLLITTVVYILLGVAAANGVDYLRHTVEKEKTAEEQKDRFSKGKFI